MCIYVYKSKPLVFLCFESHKFFCYLVEVICLPYLKYIKTKNKKFQLNNKIVIMKNQLNFAI